MKTLKVLTFENALKNKFTPFTVPYKRYNKKLLDGVIKMLLKEKDITDIAIAAFPYDRFAVVYKK